MVYVGVLPAIRLHKNTPICIVNVLLRNSAPLLRVGPLGTPEKMPLLTDALSVPLIELIEPETRDFVFSGWQRQVEKSRCFRVVGLNSVLDAHNITRATIFNSLPHRDAAIANVPAEWKTTFPTFDNGWRVCKKEQFSLAYDSKPIRLDKACLSILMACYALDQAGANPSRFFEYVNIRPQMYFVDGFNAAFYNQSVRNTALETQLITATGQESSDRLYLIAGKNLVTKRTATKLNEALFSAGHRFGRVVREPYKPRRRLDSEIIIYTEDDYKLPKLRTAGTAAGAPGQSRTP